MPNISDLQLYMKLNLYEQSTATVCLSACCISSYIMG